MSLKSVLGRGKNFFLQNQVLVLLCWGLLIGTLFIFLVPPWMHYDEPGHFEYAWLVANKPGWPDRGDVDQNMRREVGASINEHRFQDYTDVYIDLLVIDEPVNIITTQVGRGNDPLYYALASLPLRLIRYSDITFQLYVGRFFSLGIFLLLLYIGFKISSELFGQKHPLTWIVPFFLSTLPSFVDIMSAVNSDVAAVLAYSLFFWCSVVMIKRGISPGRFLCLVLTLILCYYAKPTAWLAVPLSPMVILLSVFRGKQIEKFVWLGLLGFMIVGVGFVFSWQKSAPAFFYARTAQASPFRQKHAQSVVGDWVIAHESQPRSWNDFFYLLSPDDVNHLAGKQVTLGAWVWADTPTSIPFPLFWDRQSQASIHFTEETISITTTPEFHAYSVRLPDTLTGHHWIIFKPATDPDNVVYWDGLILVEGDFSNQGIPIFDGSNASRGVWHGKPFNNLIRNASAGIGWPVFSDWIQDRVFSNYYFTSARLFSIVDFHATSWYFSSAANTLFRTFWGVFGWGAVFMAGRYAYQVFLGLTSVYLIGFIIGLFWKTHGISWELVLFLCVSALSQVLMVLLRGAGSWFSQIYIPTGRYIYPAILPIATIFMSGAFVWIKLIRKYLKIPKGFLYRGYVTLLGGILLWAIVSMWIYYYRT